MKKQISIEGMSCGHCVKHVEGALGEVPGVIKVDASLEGKYAIVELEKEVPDAVLKNAIDEAGNDAGAVKEL